MLFFSSYFLLKPVYVLDETRIVMHFLSCSARFHANLIQECRNLTKNVLHENGITNYAMQQVVNEKSTHVYVEYRGFYYFLLYK